MKSGGRGEPCRRILNDYEKGDLYSQTDWNSLFIAPIIPMSG